MGNWSKLKADEKVRVIKFARLNGVSDIKTIRDTFNMYADGGYNVNGVSLTYIRNGNIQPNYNVTSYAGNVNGNKIYTFNSDINGVTNSESTVVTPEFTNVLLGNNAKTFSVGTPEYSYYNDRVKALQSYNTSPGNILPEITVTPTGNYIHTLYADGGNLVHKKSGEELGESSSLNTPYTITGDTIQIHPVSLTNDTLTALPFTIYDRDKKNTIRRLEDNARKQTRQLYIKNYNQYASDINELNKTFLDVYGGFDNKKYKQIFKNTYFIPSELLQSNLLSVLDNNSTDSYRFGYTQESISGLKLLYVDLINDTKKLPSHTKTQLQNLISNFDWDRLHSFGEPAMNALADPTITTTPQEYLAQNAYDMMQGYAYADAYFNSQGFKDRIKNLNQELLYLNYQPELKNLTPIEVIEGDNGRYGLVSKEGVNFMAGYDNADSGGSWGLFIDNHFGVGAHEGAHHNKVYNTPDLLVNEDATNETSLYYSPHYKRNYRDIPTEILLILKPSNYRNTHDAEINESYSDLIETRALLEKLGIYKSTEAGQTFTEEMYDRYLNTEEGKNDRFLLLHNKQQVIDALNLIASNTNTTNPFETSNGMYLAAFGGPLTHKKSTGGPLYPFSFEKNPFFKTPVVRYDEGGFFARLFGKKDTPPTPEEIKAERVERFINDTWETEYSVPKGYDSTTGLFYPYKSPEGGTKTIGPGFKLRKDGSGDNTMFSAKEAAKGVTREQINEKLRAQGELLYDKVLEFLNQKGNRLPVDTINPNIMNGLMDLRFLVGALGGWDNLREAVLNGDLESIKKESLVTFKDANTGKIKPDVRRNELRAEKFWHYN